MARLRFTTTLTVSAPASLPATLMQWNLPNHRRVRLLSIELLSSGSTASDSPIVLEVGRLITAGTGIFAAATKAKVDVAAETIQTACGRYTTEPGYGTILAWTSFHPMASMTWKPGGRGLLLTGALAFGLRQIAGPLVDVTLQALLEE